MNFRPQEILPVFTVPIEVVYTGELLAGENGLQIVIPVPF